MYSLRRESDGAGDSGGMSLAFYFDEESGKFVTENDARPKVGCVIRVGSTYARSYTNQDWWQTTKITEIIKETDNSVLFRTENSTYLWEKSI